MDILICKLKFFVLPLFYKLFAFFEENEEGMAWQGRAGHGRAGQGREAEGRVISLPLQRYEGYSLEEGDAK